MDFTTAKFFSRTFSEVWPGFRLGFPGAGCAGASSPHEVANHMDHTPLLQVLHVQHSPRKVLEAVGAEHQLLQPEPRDVSGQGFKPTTGTWKHQAG